MAFSGFPRSSATVSCLGSSSFNRPNKIRSPNATTVDIPSVVKVPPHQNYWMLRHKDVATQPTISLQERVCMDMEGYHEKMDKVRAMLLLLGSSNNKDDIPMESLVFIDSIQRLGVEAHFVEEIEKIVLGHWRRLHDHASAPLPLAHVSLSFRLLRQQGYYVSPGEVFKYYMEGKDGRLKERVGGDVRGLVELYEAAQLRVRGEYILEEAEKLSRREIVKKILEHETLLSLRMGWRHTLNHPVHKSHLQARVAPRNQALFGGSSSGRFIMSSEWGNSLTLLAEMDLRITQITFQDELRQVSRWWEELGVGEELKRARKEPEKWYTWAMATLIDEREQWSWLRVDLTKPIAFIYLIDDIFDLYGTIDELTLFTQAVNKWEYGAMDELPEYMKSCYKALLDTTNMMGHKIYEKYGFNPINSLKATWGTLCKAFLEEAKWFASGSLPTAEVYLENGKVSSGVHVVLLHLFFLLGLGNTRANADDASAIISSVAAILRLWDDMGSAKDEMQDGEDGSYMECYMKEHHSSSGGSASIMAEMEARQCMGELIEMEWKKLNTQYFTLYNDSMNTQDKIFKKGCLNLARMVPLMYTYDDNRGGLPLLQQFVCSHLTLGIQ